MLVARDWFELKSVNFHSPGPSVDAWHLEAVVPSTGISALILGARAHAMTVRLAVFPAAAERAAVLEVESTATDLCSLLRTGLWRLRRQRVLHSCDLFVSIIFLQFRVVKPLILDIESKCLTSRRQSGLFLSVRLSAVPLSVTSVSRIDFYTFPFRLSSHSFAALINLRFFFVLLARTPWHSPPALCFTLNKLQTKSRIGNRAENCFPLIRRGIIAELNAKYETMGEENTQTR